MTSRLTQIFRTVAAFAVISLVVLGLGLSLSRAEVVSDPPSGVCFTTVPEYVAFYRGAFGYSYYANIPFSVRVCGYSPAQMSNLNYQIATGKI